MSVLKKIFFFVSFFYIPIVFYGQGDTASLVENFSKKNYVQPYIGTFSRSLLFNSNEKKDGMHDILFSPNSAPFAGLSLSYKKVNLYLEASLPNTELVNKENTSVRSVSLFAHHFKEKFGITAFASYNKGLLMYMPNNETYGDRNDLRMITIGAHLYTIFNGKQFSYSAANSLTKLQTKSRGSVMLMVSPVFRRLFSTESILPDSLRQFHLNGAVTPSNSLQFVALQCRPGYTYNFVFNHGKYFIAPAVYVGGGTEYHSYKSGDQWHKGFNYTTGYRIKTVAGVNAKSDFLSLEFLRDSNTSYLYKTNIRNTYTEMSCNFGMRF